jgi:hypothetical protein
VTFPNLLFKIHFESEEVSMEKVVLSSNPSQLYFISKSSSKERPFLDQSNSDEFEFI